MRYKFEMNSWMDAINFFLNPMNGDNPESEILTAEMVRVSPTLAFQSLWIISLAYCNPFPTDLEPLSTYACLGFVDVSFCKVNLKQLQLLCRKTNILRLHYFGATLIESLPHHRGFIINTCPRIWILNGAYVCCSERKHWKEYFLSNTHSIIERKWKLDKQVFVTRNTTADDQKWTEAAHYWLDDCPISFRMAVDFDYWKIKKLLCAFEQRMIVPSGIFQSLLLGENELQARMNVSLLLCLLLIASFLPEYPSTLVHQTAKAFFPLLQGRSNPFLWDSKSRAALLSITIGKVRLDYASIVKRSNQAYSLCHEEMEFLTKAVCGTFQAFYPHTQTLKNYQFDLYAPKPDEFDHSLRSALEDDLHYRWMRLLILELVSFGSNQSEFVSYFVQLNSILQAVTKQGCSDGLEPFRTKNPLELKLLLLMQIQKAICKQ
jgi:hypothetical protein